VLNEVAGTPVETVGSGDDLVVLAQQLVEQRLLVGVQVRLFDPLRDAVVQVLLGNAQLLPAILVDQFDRRAVLFRALEVVSGDVVAEDPLGDLVLLEQRRPRKATG
jgi:hypothetical protein